MKLHEIYGTFLSLVSAKERMESFCLLDFEEHESSYYGLYYIYGKKYEGESFQIVNNIDLLDNEPLEEGGFPVVLYVNNTNPDQNEVFATLEDFVLISSEHF